MSKRRPTLIERTDQEILEQIRLHLIQILRYTEKRFNYIAEISKQDLTEIEYRTLIFQQPSVIAVSSTYQILNLEIEATLIKDTSSDIIKGLKDLIENIDQELLEFFDKRKEITICETCQHFKNGIDPTVDSSRNYSEDDIFT